MRIDRALNLVIPIDRDDGDRVYFHSMPVAREIFEQYHLVLARTWARILKDGIDVAAGPAIAAMTLRQFAMETGQWEDPIDGGRPGVRNGFMLELERLTNVILPTPRGWEPMQFAEAKKGDLLSEDDVRDAENIIVFFTCASRLLRKSARPIALGGMSSLWAAQTTSLNVTDFANSLPTSTPDVNTGVRTAEGLLVPS